jgi:uncharacterized protein YggU (UPF0235/DUF167 family)
MAERIVVKAIPNARQNAVVEDGMDLFGQRFLKVKVAAAPEGGKANAAILEVVAHHLGVKTRQLTLVSGATSAHKLIEVRRDVGSNTRPLNH